MLDGYPTRQRCKVWRMKIRRRALAAPFVVTAALSSACYIVPEPAPAAQQQPAQTAGAQSTGSAGTAPAQSGGAAPTATEPAPTVVSNPPPPQTAGAYTPTAEDRQLAEQVVAVIEQMAKAAEAYPSDCDRAATELKIIVDKNRSLIEAANKMDNDPARRKWVEDTYGTRMMAAMQKIMPLMQKCQDHAGLKAVFESMSK